MRSGPAALPRFSAAPPPPPPSSSPHSSPASLSKGQQRGVPAAGRGPSSCWPSGGATRCALPRRSRRRCGRRGGAPRPAGAPYVALLLVSCVIEETGPAAASSSPKPSALSEELPASVFTAIEVLDAPILPSEMQRALRALVQRSLAGGAPAPGEAGAGAGGSKAEPAQWRG
eukprot:tig00020660_g12560.t1